MPDKPVKDSQYWRDRAMTVRAKADQMKTERSKRVLRGMADVYDRAADAIEQRLRESKKTEMRAHMPPSRYRGPPMPLAHVAQGWPRPPEPGALAKPRDGPRIPSGCVSGW